MRSALRWCDPLRLPLLCEDPLREIQALLDLAKSPLPLLHLPQSLPQVVELAEFGLHLVEQLGALALGWLPSAHATARSQLIRGDQPPGDHLGGRDGQDDEPHADGPHGYLKHAPSPWRAGVLTYHARAPRSVTAFPRAPPEGRTRVMEGSRPYTAVNARRISLATFASPLPLAPSPLPSSTSTAPPQPAPVRRAPSAPARRAAATTRSSSGALHWYRRRHDSWASYRSSPNRRIRPRVRSCAPNRVRAVSPTTCSARERSGSARARLRPAHRRTHTSPGTSTRSRAPAASHSARRSLSAPALSSCRVPVST